MLAYREDRTALGEVAGLHQGSNRELGCARCPVRPTRQDSIGITDACEIGAAFAHHPAHNQGSSAAHKDFVMCRSPYG